jgi:hypothetical protein
MKTILNWLLNRNILVGWLNGRKTQLGGILAGAALTIDGIVSFLPPELAQPLLIISQQLKVLAGVFGVAGAIGKVAKN